MDIVKLPIDKRPIISTYQHLAYIFSILGNSTDARLWLANNYTQVLFKKDELNQFTFYIPFFDRQEILDCEKLEIQTLKDLNIDCLNFTLNAINSNKYVYTHLDEFYVPHRLYYGLRHYIHDCLLFGYNEKTKSLSILGYDDTNKYTESELPYDSFMSGLTSTYIYTLQKNKSADVYLDEKKIIYDLRRYLNIAEENTFSNKYLLQCKFGITIWSELEQHVLEKKEQKEAIDFRYLKFFYEHKKVMFLRLNELYKRFLFSNNILDEYKFLEQESFKCILKFLKEKDSYTSVSASIAKITNKEKLILINLLKEMEEKIK